MNFSVSINGVLIEAGRVVLLQNERDEWELPSGRLEPGEASETCLVREFAEELGAVVEVDYISSTEYGEGSRWTLAEIRVGSGPKA